VQEVSVDVDRNPLRAARTAVCRNADRLDVNIRPNGLHHNRRRRLACPLVGPAAAAPASIGLDPGASELLPVEVIDEEVCGRVETD